MRIRPADRLGRLHVLITGTGYGRVVALRVDAGLAHEVRAALPFWWTPTADAPEQVFDVHRLDAVVPSVRALELWVAEHARDVVFVHAAAVAVDGYALLLPGRSTAGKTTLTAALLAAGAHYLSDEYAVLDADGLVHPYPRPLSVRTDTVRRAVPATELGAPTVTAPVPVAAVAVLRHVPDATWTPRALSGADAVLRLLDNTVSAQTSSEAALDAAVAAVRDARTVEGVRGEAADVVDDLLGLLSGHGTM